MTSNLMKRMNPRQIAVTTVALTFAMQLAACGGGDNAVKIPDSPDGTVKTVMAELVDNNPRVMWDAMPPTWQKDVDGLVDGFADKIDAEMYDKTFAVLGKASDVLKSKKSLFLELLNDPQMGQAMPVDTKEVSAHYDTIVGLVNTIAKSDIATVKGLKSADIGKFLGTTGSKLMADIEKMQALMPPTPGLGFEETKNELRNVKIEVVSTTDTTATLKSTTDGRTTELKLKKVEGRWVPEDMANDWDAQMANAKAELAKMTGQEMTANKDQYMAMLNMIDTGLGTIAKASNKAELQQAVMGMFGAIGAQMMGPAMGPNMGPGSFR